MTTTSYLTPPPPHNRELHASGRARPVASTRRGAQRELLLQRLKERLNRHRTRHPSDVANARLLERQIAQAEQAEQWRAKPQAPIQEVIPADAYIFIPGDPKSAAKAT